MRRLAFLLVLILITGQSSPIHHDRPNVLIIVADDMGADAWGRSGIGSNVAATPNLDSLADTGVTFSNAWATPTCSPTRAAILSGLYGTKTGVVEVGDQLDLSVETFFEAVDRVTGGEYAIGSFGKWHIGPNRDLDNPNQQGADHFHGYLGGAPMEYSNWSRVINGVSDTSSDYLTTDITTAAIEWKAQQTSPWMIWMAHASAHSPVHTPPDSLYTRDMPTTTLDQYLAMIEAMDHETGRLLASMSEAERENTIIVFMGDNGTPQSVLQGFPNRRGKGTLYQGGLNVPMFVSGHGVERSGETDDALVHVMDVHATMLDIMGADMSGGVNNSFSFKDQLSASNAKTRPYLLSETRGNAGYGFAIRDDQYKVIHTESGDPEFFDLATDPLERTNLLDSGLSTDLQQRYDFLVLEAQTQLIGWSCNDGIMNGSEDATTCATGTSTETFELPNESTIAAAYPNPTSADVTLELNTSSQSVVVSVYSITGERMLRTRINDSSWQTTLPTADLPPGMYLIRVRSDRQPGAVDTVMITKL